jgi:hypothetical protein
MDPQWIRFIGIALNVCGSMILAVRVTRMLRALALVAAVHDVNILSLNTPGPVGVHLTNSTKHVERARGYFLLALGFFLIIAGLILQGIAVYLTIGVSKA